MNTETIINTVEEVIPSIVKFVPALAPYGAPLALAIEAVATIAPPLYAEIKLLIEHIHAGGEPTAEQVDSLRAIVANLKNPESYFPPPVTPPPVTPNNDTFHIPVNRPTL